MKILLTQKFLTDNQLQVRNILCAFLQYVPNTTKIRSGKSLMNIKYELFKRKWFVVTPLVHLVCSKLSKFWFGVYLALSGFFFF